MSFAKGPADGLKKLLPAETGDIWPPSGMRAVVGLKPYVPQHRAGMRMEPGKVS
jgi:hypothetical protein